MIVVFTQSTTRGKFRARAEAQPDNIGSNWPATRLGVSHVCCDENAAAFYCARKAVKVLHHDMVVLTRIRLIPAGVWKVNFEKGAA